MSKRSVTSLVCVILTCSAVQAGDWTQWRGPNHNNVAEAGQSAPTEWSDTKNVIWKVDVPGRGHASPVITGNTIVLCSADDQSQTQAVMAFDREQGKPLWRTQISQGGFPRIQRNNTHASPTAATDGKHLFATFCHHEKIEAVCLDLEGNILWRKDVGRFHPKLYEYGYAASPTIYRDKLIVSGECDTIAWLTALNISDGSIAWEQKRELMLNWSSPIVAGIAGRDQLLLSGTNKISSYNPDNGELLWSTPCLTMATCGTCTWEGDLIFASGGYPKSETVAVKADGSGVVWKNNVRCYEQSMVVSNGHLYAFSDNGIVYCWNAGTGEEMWKERLQGPVSASPLVVGDTIFATNEAGTTWVFKSNPEKYEQLAENQLGDSSFASLVAADNQLFIRAASGEGAGRKETLCCIGSK